MLQKSVFFLLGILPLAGALLYALGYAFGLTGALQESFTLRHWERLLLDGGFWRSLLLSGLMAFAVTALSAGLALRLLPVLLPWLDRKSWRFVFYLPLAVPPLIAGVLSLQWLGNSGMLARLAVAMGLSENNFPVLINDPAQIGLGFTLFMLTFPFTLLVIRNHHEGARLTQLSDLAATLGASPAQIRRKVQAPILLRRAAPTLFLSAVFLFGAFEAPMLLGRQYPAMISVYINQKFSRFNLDDVPLAYAATVVYALLLLAALAFFLHRKKQEES